MDKLSSVSRKFYRKYSDGTINNVGYIDVTLFSKMPQHFNELYSNSVKDWLIGNMMSNKNTKNLGYMELNIEYLNQNDDYYIDYDQVAVILDYPKETHIYDVIMTIFDKLTEDHSYKLDEIKYDEMQKKYVLKPMEYRDLIYCPDEFINLYPEIKNNLIDDHYLDFTRENSKYLGDYSTVEHEFMPYSYYIGRVENGIPSLDHMVIIYGTVKYNQEGNLEFVYDAPIIGKSMSREYYDITRGRIVWDVALDEKTNTYYIDPYDPTVWQKRVDEKNKQLTK